MPQAVVQGTKRDRGLSHRGQNSLVLERAAELHHDEKNSSQGFHALTIEVFLEDFTYSNAPSPTPSLSIPSLVPVLIHICSTAAQGTQSLPMNSRTMAGTNNPCPEGGSLCSPRFFLSSSLVPLTIAVSALNFCDKVIRHDD